MNNSTPTLENEPSELDEMSHREVGLIYDDSTRTILFAKGIQWKTVASSLIMYLVVVGLVKYVSHVDDYVKILKIAMIVIGMSAIFLLAVFQFWQHTEFQKIAAVEASYSSIFRHIRSKKSLLEANVLRYIILVVMIGAIVLGGYLAIITVDQLAPTSVSMLLVAYC